MNSIQGQQDDAPPKAQQPVGASSGPNASTTASTDWGPGFILPNGDSYHNVGGNSISEKGPQYSS